MGFFRWIGDPMLAAVIPISAEATADRLAVRARRIAIEQGHNRAVADYAAATARIHSGARLDEPMTPYVAGAVLALHRMRRESRAAHLARARRNVIAAIVLAAIDEDAADHR